MRYRLDVTLTQLQYVELMLAIQERGTRLLENKIDTRPLFRAEDAMRKAFNRAKG